MTESCATIIVNYYIAVNAATAGVFITADLARCNNHRVE